MGSISSQASYAVTFLTYGFFLVLGVGISVWKLSSKHFLNNNGTQKGLPLALNFIASAMGAGILTTYPDVTAWAGLQGLLIYGLASALPILLFAFAGPAIRKRCPHGFVLTEWVYQRYGLYTSLYLSVCTILTMFLYMTAELTSVQYAFESLTGLDALSVMLVQCAVTTIYTSFGGFEISFLTDNIQGAMVFLLLIICSIAIGVNVDVKPSLVTSSGYLKSSQLGWKLLYILPVAIATNDCFLSGFWLRTFASRSDRDLWIGCIIATVVIFAFLVLVGCTGLLTVWSGMIPPQSEEGAYSFFMIVSTMPGWIIGFVLVFSVSLSTAAFDSLQSGMVSTISNDFFRNKLKLRYVRALVVLTMVPAVVVATRAPNVLQIFLIADLVSSSVIPVMFLGLSKHFYFIQSWEVIGGGLGGILTVFIFGTIYYDSAREGGRLLLLMDGLYVDNWGPFGAFVAAPVGGLLSGFIVLAARSVVMYIMSLRSGNPFTVFTRPDDSQIITPANYATSSTKLDDEFIITEEDMTKQSPAASIRAL